MSRLMRDISPETYVLNPDTFSRSYGKPRSGGAFVLGRMVETGRKRFLSQKSVTGSLGRFGSFDHQAPVRLRSRCPSLSLATAGPLG